MDLLNRISINRVVYHRYFRDQCDCYPFVTFPGIFEKLNQSWNWIGDIVLTFYSTFFLWIFDRFHSPFFLLLTLRIRIFLWSSICFALTTEKVSISNQLNFRSVTLFRKRYYTSPLNNQNKELRGYDELSNWLFCLNRFMLTFVSIPIGKMDWTFPIIVFDSFHFSYQFQRVGGITFVWDFNHSISVKE